MAKVNDNEIQILATDFPSFLYDENIPYDPEYEMSGLFRGYYALRVRFILRLSTVLTDT